MDLSALLHAAEISQSAISKDEVQQMASPVSEESSRIDEQEAAVTLIAYKQQYATPEQSPAFIAKATPIIETETSLHDNGLASPTSTHSSLALGENAVSSQSCSPDFALEPPRPFKCDWPRCNKAFPRKADLTRHLRIHQNIRPFVCTHENCGKAFTQRSALKVHMRIHSGDKPHACEYEGCGKAFSDSSSLARHRKLHTVDGLTYACEEPGCNMRFAKKVYLLRHRKAAHPGKFSPSSNTSSGQSSPMQQPTASPSPVLSRTSTSPSGSPTLPKFSLTPVHPYNGQQPLRSVPMQSFSPYAKPQQQQYYHQVYSNGYAYQQQQRGAARS